MAFNSPRGFGHCVGIPGPHARGLSPPGTHGLVWLLVMAHFRPGLALRKHRILSARGWAVAAQGWPLAGVLQVFTVESRTCAILPISAAWMVSIHRPHILYITCIMLPHMYDTYMIHIVGGQRPPPCLVCSFDNPTLFNYTVERPHGHHAHTCTDKAADHTLETSSSWALYLSTPSELSVVAANTPPYG